MHPLPASGRRPAIPLPAVLAVAALGIAACGSSAAPTQQAQTLASPSAVATVAVTTAPTLAASPVTVKVTPIAGAPDSGVVVQLIAHAAKWSVSTMEAPAGQVWHVQIDMQDPPPGRHNFDVSSGPAFAQRIFTSPLMTALGSYTFDIPALPAGSYLFICTVHPIEMTGTLTIGG